MKVNNESVYILGVNYPFKILHQISDTNYQIEESNWVQMCTRGYTFAIVICDHNPLIKKKIWFGVSKELKVWYCFAELLHAGSSCAGMWRSLSVFHRELSFAVPAGCIYCGYHRSFRY